MFVAGVFGTVAGDLMNRTVGVLASAAALTALLTLVLLVRARWFPGLMPAYWVAVLAERAAGTPVGDGLASRHGMALGVPGGRGGGVSRAYPCRHAKSSPAWSSNSLAERT